jgi:protein CpxP
MRKTFLLPSVLFAAALATGVSVSALAFDGGHGGRHHGSPFIHELHELNLSDAQKASVKNLVKNSFAQSKPQAQAFRQQREAFEALAPNDPRYAASASSLAQAAGAQASARVTQLTELKQQIFAVLTPAQQQQLAAMEAKHQAKRAEWQEKHPDGGNRGGQ